MAAERGAVRRIEKAALWALGLIVVAAEAAAFAESYTGLKSWATGHRVDEGWTAYAWPLQVDAYILAGEILLLVAAIRQWPLRVRVTGWAISGSGLAVSVAANAGHVGHDASWTDHATAAVPPIAAMAGLVAALITIKHLTALSTPVDTSGQGDRASGHGQEGADTTAMEAATVTAPAATIPEDSAATSESPQVDDAATPIVRVAELVARRPDVTGEEIGALLGVSARTGRRLKRQVLNGHAPTINGHGQEGADT